MARFLTARTSAARRAMSFACAPRIRRGGPNECWPWTGAVNDQGYGQFNYRAKRHYIHRTVYELVKGPIPHKHHVMHSCDNPPCCNPAHLSTGKARDNHMDALKKGRWAIHNPCRGEDHHQSRLTVSDVREIRKRYQDGATQRSLAVHYGVTQPAIQLVTSGKTWKHVA